MSLGSAFGPSDLFSELFSRFPGMSPASSPPPVQRVPIGRRLAGSSRELLARAPRRTIRTELDNKIASPKLSRDAEPGRTIVADAVDGTIRRTVRGAGEPAKDEPHA